MKTTISISLDFKVSEALNNYSKETDCSVSATANKILKEYLIKTKSQGGNQNEIQE